MLYYCCHQCSFRRLGCLLGREGLEFLLRGGLRFTRRPHRRPLSPVPRAATAAAAAQRLRQRAHQGVAEHGAGEAVDDGVQRRVEEGEAERHNGELGEGVEGGAVDRSLCAYEPQPQRGHRAGQEADGKHDHDRRARLHGPPHVLRLVHLPTLQDAEDARRAEEQHGQGHEELQHRQDAVHAHQDEDGPRRLPVGREEETLGLVAFALDMAERQHRNPRSDD